MPRHADDPLTQTRSPPPPKPGEAPSPDEVTREDTIEDTRDGAREGPSDGTGEGMLDLDDHDQINNQHLEVR